MSVDIAAMAPSARKRYLSLGRRYLTAAVLAQLDKTAGALAVHGPELVRHGFGPSDGQRVSHVREALGAQDIEHDTVASERRISGLSYADTVRQARSVRLDALSALLMAEEELCERGIVEVEAFVQTTLDDTSRVTDDESLLKHLNVLQKALQHPQLGQSLAGRGGPEILAEVLLAHAELDTVLRERAIQSAVTAAAEQREILDGLGVTLARGAYRAARLAARRLGQPSLAAAFKLTHLKRSRPGESEPATPAPGGEQPATGPGNTSPAG